MCPGQQLAKGEPQIRARSLRSGTGDTLRFLSGPSVPHTETHTGTGMLAGKTRGLPWKPNLPPSGSRENWEQILEDSQRPLDKGNSIRCFVKRV